MRQCLGWQAQNPFSSQKPTGEFGNQQYKKKMLSCQRAVPIKQKKNLLFHPYFTPANPLEVFQVIQDPVEV